MIFDLTKLQNTRASLDLSFEPGEIDLELPEVKLSKEVGAAIEIVKGIAQTEVHGKISTVAEIDCSRCLNGIETVLEIPFRAAFVSPEYYSEQAEKELDSDELDVSISENDEIDLKELVREQILLALPAQFLCSEDCKGLCPVCGANKNLIDCNCRENETDPRWAGLKNLIT
mgnify:CR=1 FL=1